MRRPVIGITCPLVETNESMRLRLDHLYVRVIEEAGGSVFLIPPQSNIDVLLDRIDGLLIPGGDDIDPRHYGQEPHPENKLVPPQRYEFDRAVLERMEAAEKPVLGICYGSQLLNVARGGALHQHLPDLPDTLKHRRDPGETGHPLHVVRLETDSRLYELMSMKEFEIVSAHHQSVQSPGKGLRPVAYSPDGIIEAVEDSGKPFYIGVQWHPERAPDSPATRQLLKAFVESCRK